jgi:hypothetical protein
MINPHAKMSRRQVETWLHPIRCALRQLKTGEADSIKGYAVTRLDEDDSYARTDFCLAGFRALIERLLPAANMAPLLKVEKSLANGVLMQESDVDACLEALRAIVKPLMGIKVGVVMSAVRTEQVQIEIDALGLAA